MMGKAKFALLLLATGLAGCGGLGDAANKFPVPPIPDAVKSAMAAPFPDDGRVHVTATKGKFVIKPETPFCGFPTGGGLTNEALETLFQRLGQPREFNSQRAGKQWRGNPEFGDKYGGWMECYTGNPIANYSETSPNRSGKPYRLMLAVWQGDVGRGGAMWVAGVERKDERWHSGAMAPRDDTPGSGADRGWHDRLVADSKDLDGQDLSIRFQDFVR